MGLVIECATILGKAATVAQLSIFAKKMGQIFNPKILGNFATDGLSLPFESLGLAMVLKLGSMGLVI